MANDVQEEDDPLATTDGEELKNTDVADTAVSPDVEDEEATQTPLTELEVARQEANENLDRYLRLAADLDNLRKRSARELENARKYGLERLAQSLLPVRDSLSAGVANAENADVGVLLEGKRATLRLLDAALEQAGIVELDPEGEPFDPARHEAMTMQHSTTSEPNTVLTVVQTGYAIHDRLLRPARVIVAQEEPAAGEQ